MNRRLSILLALTNILLWTVLISACKPEARSQASQPTVASSTPSSLTTTVVNTSSVISARLPPCQFTQDVSATQLPLQATSLDEYVFSEPTVVMTSSKDVSILHVVQWLPDNRRLLIKRSFPNTRRLAFEILDTITGQSQVYAEAHEGRGGFWLDQQQAVIYSEHVAADRVKGEWHTEWWISYGDPSKAQRLAADMPYYTASFDIDRQRIIQWQTDKTLPYSLDKLPTVLPVEALPFNPDRWTYRRYPEALEPTFDPATYSFAVSNRADGSLIAFYGAPWLFLFDTRTNQACEIELGLSSRGQPWRATRAHWSPSGRYLALKLLADLPEQLASDWRTMILDTTTGATYELNAYSDEMDWVPAQDHLLALDNFTLVDATSKRARQLTDDTKLKDMIWAAPKWTSNGQTIAADCFAPKPQRESRICLIPITIQP